MVKGFRASYGRTLLYGTSIAAFLFLLKWLQLRFIIFDHALEIYVGAIAFIFTGLGVWLALKLSRPKVETVVVERDVYIRHEAFKINQAELTNLGISKRELEVLELMSQGLSNNEIAERLFVSLSTVKTHSRSLFDKLGATRRTQAIDRARRLSLIP